MNQPTFGRSVASPTPATISLKGIADYFWSIFSADAIRRVPIPKRAQTNPPSDRQFGQTPPVANAAPCSPTGVVLDVPGTYPTIQAAVNAANSSGGDTIAVAAGTFTEQLSVDKCVSIIGAGLGSTIIRSPATLTASTIPGSANVQSIVEIRNNSYVTMKDLTISGPVTFSPTAGTYGVYVAQLATLNMRNTRVTAIHEGSTIGNTQDGQGVGAGSITSGSAGSLDFDGVTIDDYQETGIIVDNTGSTATITNTSVTGNGPTGSVAQTGILISYGATGTISNSTIAQNQYIPNNWAAVGVLILDAGADGGDVIGWWAGQDGRWPRYRQHGRHLDGC
ncbi:MAG: right-handed parallel beta-helix repeat-containing protein [Acidobacteria bacterium]|nr:right-handed parallel beta-helix repeat-containing protein [Acidobacteriota bacterium]